jgi:hypothetical protein
MNTDEAPINAGTRGIFFIRVNPCPSVVQKNFYHGWARINTDKTWSIPAFIGASSVLIGG